MTKTNETRDGQPVALQASVGCLVVGDSWSSAVVAGEGDHAGWPLMLGISDDMRQAVAGSTAAQWASDFEGRLTRAVCTSANVVIMSLLGNDAFAALADGSVTPEEISTGVSALHRVICAVRKARSIVILYADPFCGRDPRTAVLCPLLNAAICASLPERVETFDTRHILKPDHFDGHDIHPNRTGHEAIADGLRQMLTANNKLQPTAAPGRTSAGSAG